MQKETPERDSVGKPTLNALFISLDNNLLNAQQGDVIERHLQYAQNFKQLNIILLTTKKDGFSAQVYLAENLRVIPTNSNSRWLFVVDALKVFRNIQKQQRIDIVSAQDPFITAIAGIVIKLLSGTQLNIQIHNDYGSPYWKNESLQNRIFSLLFRITLPFADSVRAVSTLTSKMMKNSSKVFIAPVAVDLNFFKPSKAKKNIDIICVARLDKQKNIPFLVEVIADVKKNYPRLKTLIVSEGPQRGEIEDDIRKRGLTKTITLVGRVKRTEVRSLLTKSRIFILPSNYEGWGLAAVEAAACGLPVVMTDTGGAREIVDNGITGYVVPVADKLKLTEKITVLIKNQDRAKRMGILGKIRVSKLMTRYQNAFIENLIRSVSGTEKG
jgi:glycosyltransferase involved in cell wall biosynthesis